mmetsp:Transcript_26627/g.56261  ORF Transcript_26627/g.56261 Transcript_26627/m.56261 type:complete len:104 (+) Transcript_26627:172-483(+)
MAFLAYLRLEAFPMESMLLVAFPSHQPNLASFCPCMESIHLIRDSLTICSSEPSYPSPSNNQVNCNQQENANVLALRILFCICFGCTRHNSGGRSTGASYETP